ncbi:hypothetical protein ACQPXS_37575 [Streptomyces sp. CA-142005]|uniref:hypothetical protein n=1 Tax=Streptomyces sp. CA-142005 TaxID=3240052 RepID=UPI003D8C065F
MTAQAAADVVTRLGSDADPDGWWTGTVSAAARPPPPSAPGRGADRLAEDDPRPLWPACTPGRRPREKAPDVWQLTG